MLKALAGPILRGEFGIVVPKRVGAYRFLTQPRFLSAEQPEAHVVHWILKSLDRGGTFFDVGAHYGWLSMVAAQHAGPGGTIVAFEASPVLHSILSFHKRVNRLQQLRLVYNVISNASEERTSFFLVNDGLSFRNSLVIGDEGVPYLEPGSRKRIEVQSITLDDYVMSSGVIPDLIKIDVEGAEGLVLEGAKRTLQNHHPDIILGVHPYWLPPIHSEEKIRQFLRSLEYEIADEHVVLFDQSYVADYFCKWSAQSQIEDR